MAVLALATVFEPEAFPQLARLAEASDTAAFLLRYWWSPLFAAVAVQFVFFLVAAARNSALPLWQRAVWAVAMLLFVPLAVPAYWWLHSAREESAQRGV